MNECLSLLLCLIDDKLVLHHVETYSTRLSHIRSVNELCHVYERVTSLSLLLCLVNDKLVLHHIESCHIYA